MEFVISLHSFTSNRVSHISMIGLQSGIACRGSRVRGSCVFVKTGHHAEM